MLILIIAFVLTRGRKEKQENLPKEETALLDLSLDKRPLVSLTPTSDGHYLNMKVEKIEFNAFSLDYELLYQVPGGVQQGVPGSVNLEGKSEFKAELLLGSESSGKFRYDEGVEEGTLSLRFRDEDGQLLVKFETDFHMQSETNVLTSLDGKFSYIFDDIETEKGYFIVMNTIGVPKEAEGKFGNIERGPYGTFSSVDEGVSGEVKFDLEVGYFRLDSEGLVDVRNNKSTKFGIFVVLGE